MFSGHAKRTGRFSGVRVRGLTGVLQSEITGVDAIIAKPVMRFDI